MKGIYRQSPIFSSVTDMTERMGMFQFVEFKTWERIIKNKIKTSILDHIYAKDSSTINIFSIFLGHPVTIFTATAP